MLEGKLDEARANIIRNAILTDGTVCGSQMWLENHHIGREEFETFLEYGYLLAAMYTRQAENDDRIGALTVEGEIKDKMTVKSSSAVITFEVAGGSVDRMRSVLGQNVVLQIRGDQMSFGFDDFARPAGQTRLEDAYGNRALVDLDTGEVM